MKVFVTRNVLIHGIRELEVEPLSHGSAVHENANGREYFFASQWTPDKDVALARANTQVLKKIAQLERQLAKVKALKFE